MADPKVDPYAYLGISPNPDGSVNRFAGGQTTPECSDPGGNAVHLSKDIPVNQSKGTWARIFVPRGAVPAKKLPLVVYFHGGGFVVCQVNSTEFDGLYAAIVAETPAVVVSVGYRLAPEHRLPAAFDDAEESLQWLKGCKDEWLMDFADFSRCFLMGTSAGGNIVYQVGLRAAAASTDRLLPLQIKGLILHNPFFGGVHRTESELRLAANKMLPLPVCDLLWDLSLPAGADRDHEFCNAAAAIRPGQFDAVKDLGWRVLVAGCRGDLLVDRTAEMAAEMEANGVAVVGRFDEGGFHACDVFDPARTKVMAAYLKEFIQSAAIAS